MVTEENLCDFLSKIIKEKKKISQQDFIALIPKHFNLDEDDNMMSKTRPNEKMYVQRARNINCHRNFPPNVEYKNQIFYLKK